MVAHFSVKFYILGWILMIDWGRNLVHVQHVKQKKSRWNLQIFHLDFNNFIAVIYTI